MQTKHTPAPWSLHHGLKKWNEDFYTKDIHVKSIIVAKAHGNSKEEAEANAKLIAAAPELLQSLYELWSLNPHYVSKEVWENANDKAKKAIDKATL